MIPSKNGEYNDCLGKNHANNSLACQGRYDPIYSFDRSICLSLLLRLFLVPNVVVSLDWIGHWNWRENMGPDYYVDFPPFWLVGLIDWITHQMMKAFRADCVLMIMNSFMMAIFHSSNDSLCCCCRSLKKRLQAEQLSKFICWMERTGKAMETYTFEIQGLIQLVSWLVCISCFLFLRGKLDNDKMEVVCWNCPEKEFYIKAGKSKNFVAHSNIKLPHAWFEAQTLVVNFLHLNPRRLWKFFYFQIERKVIVLAILFRHHFGLVASLIKKLLFSLASYKQAIWIWICDWYSDHANISLMLAIMFTYYTDIC